MTFEEGPQALHWLQLEAMAMWRAGGTLRTCIGQRCQCDRGSVACKVSKGVGQLDGRPQLWS